MENHMLMPSNFVFQKNKVDIPHYISVVTPPAVQDALHTARQAADAAFDLLKWLDLHYARRFHRLCPIDDYARLESHSVSVERLFSWREEYVPENPMLVANAKMPKFIFAFYVDEEAYRDYVYEHERMKLQYLNGPYYNWQRRAQDFEYLLWTSGIAEVDKRRCLEWWNEFKQEMKIWELRFDELVLPSWQEMIDKLAGTIEVVVDLDNEWETS